MTMDWFDSTDLCQYSMVERVEDPQNNLTIIKMNHNLDHLWDNNKNDANKNNHKTNGNQINETSTNDLMKQ